MACVHLWQGWSQCVEPGRLDGGGQVPRQPPVCTDPREPTCARTCLLFSNNATLLMAAHNLAGVSMRNLIATSLHLRDELPSASLTARPWLPTWRTTWPLLASLIASSGSGTCETRVWSGTCQRPEHLDGRSGHLPTVLGSEDCRGAPGIPI